jgi:CRISPR-associated endonuclease/helicase Cas3
LPDAQVALRQSNDAEALEEALRRAEGGQQVLWIENTVNEAQDLFRSLAARAHGMGVACGLLHSRFTKADRAANEAIWVTHFGKDGAATRGRQGRILVGTQVLEQSLDIDADFLVTRIAPTDMVLQRLGRLWRHSETVRPPGARQEAWLLAPNPVAIEENPELAFGATAKVYDP